MAKDIEKLNAAYEALENMRKLNLEITCEELRIPFDATSSHAECTTCLMAKQGTKQANNNNNNTMKNRLPQLRNLGRRLVPTKPPPACLICGSPVCRNHSSGSFRRENITICNECETLFGLGFIIDCLTEPNPTARRRKIQHMIDSYDRALLLLRYSAQYVDDIANALEASTARRNHIGLGSSSANLVSGALGVAAAATVFTPVGPPLLIASLFFGGSATAVQTSTEAMHYWSEPNKLADRILALHGVVLSILRITGIFRDAMMREHVRTDFYHDPALFATSGESLQKILKRHRGTLLGTMAGLSTKMAGTYYGAASVAMAVDATADMTQAASVAETSLAAGRNARFFTRTSTSIMNTVSLARFAGGALSAAIILFEARNLTTTLRAIHSGNPCDKATTLRLIQEEMDELPHTDRLERECDHYLQVMEDRVRAMTEEEVTKILMEQNEAALEEERQLAQLNLAEDKSVDPANELGANVVVTASKTEEDDSSTSPTSSSVVTSASDKTCLSLLERIELFKQHEAQHAKHPSSPPSSVVTVTTTTMESTTTATTLLLQPTINPTSGEDDISADVSITDK